MLSAYFSLRSYSHLSIIFIVLISNSQLLLMPFPRCSIRALFLVEGFIYILYSLDFIAESENIVIRIEAR